MTPLEAVVVDLARSASGRVLDLGVGPGTTVLLSKLASFLGRVVVSVEVDPVWHRWASALPDRPPWHRVLLVPSWESFEPTALAERYSVAIVDVSPGSARAPLVERLRGLADFVVVDDVEESSRALYPGLEEALAAFRSVRRFSRLGYSTVAVATDLP